MKKNFTMLTALLVCTMAFSQVTEKPAVKQLPTFIKVDASKSASSRTELFTEYLQMTQDDKLKSIKTDTDKLGMTHEKFQQYYKGVKVDGAIYSTHSLKGAISHMTGNYRSVSDLDVNPSLTAPNALTSATANIGAQKYAWDAEDNKFFGEVVTKPTGELVIINDPASGNKERLAYKFDIYAAYPMSRNYVYVDAKTGEVFRKINRIHEEHDVKKADATGSAATRYSGTQSVNTDSNSGSYRLRDYTRGNGIITYDATTATSTNNQGSPSGSSEYTDSDNNWTSGEYNNNDKDNAALDAHFAAEATYDFFMTSYGRSSYDGNGATINSYVNTDIEDVFNYPAGYNDNAFWTGYVMVYGKGGTYDPLTTVDITAHEIGHAFCEKTANLVYSYESGAINESLSDIWGTCVENYTNTNFGTNKDLWNLGSEIGTTFRSMSNPNAHGQPDTYLGTSWYTGSGDNGGVHYNSGVGNHWFYLLTVGKSGTNDNGDAYSVSALGIEKAAAITWRSESVYLGSTSQYADWRTVAIQSAEDLYGAESNEVQQVTNAWHAVGVGAAYAEPIGCVTADVTLTITFDNYPEETSWTLASGGSNVASGGTYDSQADGSTIVENLNLAAGDYTFTITDVYGDGICCSYGSGSYSLVSGGVTIVSGGNFGSSAATDFCIEGSGGGGGGDTEAPTAPSNLSSSDITTTSANVSWSASSDNVGVDHYNVYVDGSLEGTTAATSYALSGLTASTTYSVTVTAEDAAGNVSAEGAIDVTTSDMSSTVLLASYFESGWDGWSDGGSDSYRYTGTRSYEGSYSIRLRDNNDQSTMTSAAHNVSSYNSIEIEFYFYPNGMETGEDFWVQYYDGSSWNTVASYASGTSFNNGSFYTSTATISSTDYSFPSNAQFRFRCDASGNNDQIYIDQVTITGSTAQAFNNNAIALINTPFTGFAGIESNEIEIDDVMIYPNPVRDIMNIMTVDDISSVKVFSASGAQFNVIVNNNTINVSELKKGFYVLSIETVEGEKFVHKFLKE